MARIASVTVASFLALILTSTAVRADEIKLVGSAYYPTKVGTTWTYQIAGQEMVSKIAKHEKIGDRICARLESTLGGQNVANEHISVTPEHIARTAFQGQTPDNPVILLKLPPKKGDTWKIDTKVGNETVKGEFTVAEEELTVPAGKYKTFKVSGDFKINDMDGKFVYWFAQNVGVVKQQINIAGNEVISELTKFEDGK